MFSAGFTAHCTHCCTRTRAPISIFNFQQFSNLKNYQFFVTVFHPAITWATTPHSTTPKPADAAIAATRTHGTNAVSAPTTAANSTPPPRRTIISMWTPMAICRACPGAWWRIPGAPSGPVWTGWWRRWRCGVIPVLCRSTAMRMIMMRMRMILVWIMM